MRSFNCRSVPIVATTLYLFTLAGCRKAAAPPPSPVAVDTTAASIQTVPLIGSWVATLDGMVNVQIQPQVGGYMIRQDYKEGTTVRKGQVLFEIDPRPWQAIQDQASGSLDQARAQYKLATINVARDTPLVEAHAYPQSSLDTELGTQEADKASVESAEATLESAKLNVGFTKVRSLIDGVAGQAAIQAGNLVSTTSQLVEVSQLNPIMVYFFVNEQEYMSLSARAHGIGKTDLLSTGDVLPLTLTLANNQKYSKTGHVVSVALRLPQSSSLKRTSEASTDVEKALMKVAGVKSVTSVIGFSLLSATQSTNNAFFFVSLKDWSQRNSHDQQFTVIQSNLAKALGGIKQGIAFSFPPPSIPGVGSSGGVTMVLEDRTSKSDAAFLAQNVARFLATASKRPEIALVVPTYYPIVPQLRVEVDKEKVAQQQVQLSDVYTALSAFLGGDLVNYFNRFGRQWQTYVEADGVYGQDIKNIDQLYVQSANGNRVPLSALVTVKRTTGPEFTTRFNEFEAATLTVSGAPGFSSGQVMAALEQVFAQSMPKGMGYDYEGMSYQEHQAAIGLPAWVVYALSIVLCFLILAAQYESWSLLIQQLKQIVARSLPLIGAAGIVLGIRGTLHTRNSLVGFGAAARAPTLQAASFFKFVEWCKHRAPQPA